MSKWPADVDQGVDSPSSPLPRQPGFTTTIRQGVGVTKRAVFRRIIDSVNARASCTRTQAVRTWIRVLDDCETACEELSVQHPLALNIERPRQGHLVIVDADENYSRGFIVSFSTNSHCLPATG